MICTTPPFRSLGRHVLDFLVDLTQQRVPIRGEERSDVLQIDRPAGGELEQDQIAGERDRNDDAAYVQRFRALEDLQLPFPCRQQHVGLHSLGEGDVNDTGNGILVVSLPRIDGCADSFELAPGVTRDTAAMTFIRDSTSGAGLDGGTV